MSGGGSSPNESLPCLVTSPRKPLSSPLSKSRQGTEAKLSKSRQGTEAIIVFHVTVLPPKIKAKLLSSLGNSSISKRGCLVVQVTNYIFIPDEMGRNVQ